MARVKLFRHYILLFPLFINHYFKHSCNAFINAFHFPLSISMILSICSFFCLMYLLIVAYCSEFTLSLVQALTFWNHFFATSYSLHIRPGSCRSTLWGIIARGWESLLYIIWTPKLCSHVVKQCRQWHAVQQLSSNGAWEKIYRSIQMTTSSCQVLCFSVSQCSTDLIRMHHSTVATVMYEQSQGPYITVVNLK